VSRKEAIVPQSGDSGVLYVGNNGLEESQRRVAVRFIEDGSADPFHPFNGEVDVYWRGISGGAANRGNIALEGDDGRESPGPRVNSSSRRYENRDRSSATSLPGPARREACEAYIRLEAFFGGLAGIDGAT